MAVVGIGGLPQASAQILLPEPGVMVPLSPAYEAPLMKGIIIHRQNPFLFDFIIDKGDVQWQDRALRQESDRLIKYFMTGLAVPRQDLWVNLSPYENTRIIPDSLVQTAMGRDLLTQDYMLKQVTASLAYPEKELGRQFWKRIYMLARQRYGAAVNIPVNAFNKVWIMPDKAEVFVRHHTAMVIASHLKVMLERDYFAVEKNKGAAGPESLSEQIMREIIVPQLTKEVNEGRNFAVLRQINHALILANWYRNALKQALLNQIYTDRGNVKGIDIDDHRVKDKVFNQYMQAYKKGVFNLIKEEPQLNGQSFPRKYFAGGFAIGADAVPVEHQDSQALDKAMALPVQRMVRVKALFKTDMHGQADKAMNSFESILQQQAPRLYLVPQAFVQVLSKVAGSNIVYEDAWPDDPQETYEKIAVNFDAYIEELKENKGKQKEARQIKRVLFLKKNKAKMMDFIVNLKKGLGMMVKENMFQSPEDSIYIGTLRALELAHQELTDAEKGVLLFGEGVLRMQFPAIHAQFDKENIMKNTIGYWGLLLAPDIEQLVSEKKRRKTQLLKVDAVPGTQTNTAKREMALLLGAADSKSQLMADIKGGSALETMPLFSGVMGSGIKRSETDEEEGFEETPTVRLGFVYDMVKLARGKKLSQVRKLQRGQLLTVKQVFSVSFDKADMDLPLIKAAQQQYLRQRGDDPVLGLVMDILEKLRARVDAYLETYIQQVIDENKLRSGSAQEKEWLEKGLWDTLRKMKQLRGRLWSPDVGFKAPEPLIIAPFVPRQVPQEARAAHRWHPGVGSNKPVLDQGHAAGHNQFAFLDEVKSKINDLVQDEQDLDGLVSASYDKDLKMVAELVEDPEANASVDYLLGSDDVKKPSRIELLIKERMDAMGGPLVHFGSFRDYHQWVNQARQAGHGRATELFILNGVKISGSLKELKEGLLQLQQRPETNDQLLRRVGQDIYTVVVAQGVVGVRHFPVEKKWLVLGLDQPETYLRAYSRDHVWRFQDIAGAADAKSIGIIDAAMQGRVVNGGIDLRGDDQLVTAEGEAANMVLDPAMLARFKRGGVAFLTPHILGVIPIDSIQSIFTALGP